MATLIDQINGVVWSFALIGLCLGVGLYFSIRMRFMQLRHFKEMFRLLIGSKSSESGVSSFQALSISLSGRVGTGNIAGVATAITFGGPGAIFWMWIIAFLGASSAYVESTLAQIYKVKQKGQFRGGPAYYIEKGLKLQWYGITFAVATVISTGILLPGVQANTITSSFAGAFNINPYITGALISAFLAVTIFGGIRRIAKFAEIVVPFMALTYILIAIIVLVVNIEKIPEVIGLIYRSAFGIDSAFGAMLGAAVSWGVKRGVYSNEAGQGTGPHAAAAAEVTHPAKQGIVQAFSVYIDTIFVCSATAFMILVTGMYNVENPAGKMIFSGLGSKVSAGPEYVQKAINSVMPNFGGGIVAFSLLFFAFTTIIAYYYIAETNIAYLTRKIDRPWLFTLLKLGLVGMVFFGSVKTADLAWNLGDIGVGVMAWLNIIAIILLQKPAIIALKDYERQKKLGKDPVFSPKELNISGADFWSEMSDLAQNKKS